MERKERDHNLREGALTMITMIARIPRSWEVIGFGMALMMALGALWGASVQAQEASEEPATVVAESEPVSETGEVGPAEAAFREGVRLYKKGLFREALDEFSRALTLKPDYADAAIYRLKCESKLRLAAAGEQPVVVPSFQTFEPEAIPPEAPPGEGVLSVEEIRVQRLKYLITEAQKYLENKRYKRAQALFEEALLIDPKNQTALYGFQEATVGVYGEELEQSKKELGIDRARIRTMIEETKQLPAGADAKGIKAWRLPVEVREERYEAPVEKTAIEKALDAPVSIEFEKEHVSRILDFVSEYVDINIVIDSRVVEPPEEAAVAPAAPAAAPAVPGAPPGLYGAPGATGIYGTGAPYGGYYGGYGVTRPTLGFGAGRAGRADEEEAYYGIAAGAGLGVTGAAGVVSETVTDGMVPYINLKDVPLRQALKALLKSLYLDYSIQPGFLWITTPEKIRHESFEELETRYYELRNAGSETLFKVVLGNPGVGQISSTGVTLGELTGGGVTTGAGTTTGAGVGAGYGGYGGGYGGGGGYGNPLLISNISDLFYTIPDYIVGETPAVVGLSGLTGYYGYGGGMGGYGMGGYGMGGYGMGGYGGGGYGGYGGGGMGGYGGYGGMGGYGGYGGMGGYGGYGGMGGYGGYGGMGGYGMGGYGMGMGMGMGGMSEVILILQALIPELIDPLTGESLSFMVYNPSTNQLIARNVPSNLDLLEKQLAELDTTPKQVSIESKFITVSVSDLDKIGFNWSVTQSDLGSRGRPMLDEDGNPIHADYSFDINGDGIPESIPFYTRPDGTNVFNNTIVQSILSAATSPGPVGSFSLSGILTDRADGDTVRAVMEYLDSLTETELLSAPRVTTLNRKPAVIGDFFTRTFNTNVISQVRVSEATFGAAPIVTSAQQLVFDTFMFGIMLSVTPSITGGDQVRLWLNPTVTSLEGVDEFSQTVIVGGTEQRATLRWPRQRWQSVWTNVIVHDGDTLVLGGLISDESTQRQERTPYLADIPLIGFLFRGKSREVRQSSLLIFVTVDIIDPTGARYFESQ